MPQDAVTLKYVPRADTREYNTFTEEYFSGADVALYLDGEQIANVSGLNYTIQEQQKPIFGYASRTFDDVAVGNRIVVGSFRVPISNPEQSVDPTVDNSDDEVTAPNKPEPGDSDKPSWAESATLFGRRIYDNILPPESSEGDDKSRNIFGSSNDNMEYKNPLQYDESLKNVQKKLLQLGYNVDINGFYDTKTRKAVKEFQNENGLNETGVLDAETKAAIMAEGESADNKRAITIIPNVTLRNGPGNEYRALDELPTDTYVTIISTIDEWYYVKLDNSKKGYIAKSLLQVVE